MAQVTGLDNSPRKRNIVVSVGGEMLCEITRKLASEAGLVIGLDVDCEWLRQIALTDNVRLAMGSAGRLLELRSRGSEELARSLRRRGFDAAVIDRVLARLKQAGMIDDTQFAAEFIASRSRAHPQSLRRTRMELVVRGVGRDDVDDAISKMGEIDDLPLARAALAKCVRSLPENDAERHKLYARLASFLAGRGFGWDVARKALMELFRADETDDGDCI